MRRIYLNLACLAALLWSASLACNLRPLRGQDAPAASTPTVLAGGTPAAEALPTPSAEPRLLTICMGQEPASLFLYGDGSVAARSLRQAIYDGPQDLVQYDYVPVILQKQPSAKDGDIRIEPLSVQAGSMIVDSTGALVNLGEGVAYLPSGCNDAGCGRVYTGSDPVQMDQQVTRFQLRSGLQWSDGAPLTADDSVYSYEVAQELYPRVRADLLARTQAYQALDETTLEWRGVPGYRTSSAAAVLFTPLPRHAWGSLPLQDLLTADVSNRTPLGWGPYQIDEWTPGDHISLRRNPAYFRSGDGLPVFERLVFRFMPDAAQALEALAAGECDYLDESLGLTGAEPRLQELVSAGRVAVATAQGTAWEQLVFGIASLDTSLPPVFQSKEMRQAVALCVDRQRIAQTLFGEQGQVLDSYVPPAHPLFNPDVKRYSFDPSAAAPLLEAAGWKDLDGNPATPRQSQGAAGIPDGTPLAFDLLIGDDAEKQQLAQLLQESLAQCGIQARPQLLPPDQLFAAGPDGRLFGRRFSLAQFAWTAASEPPCFLFDSQQIPGPYPQQPRGWGGGNASGYSNPEFDRLCRQALAALPASDEQRAAHLQAQALFAEDLPALPLYARQKVIATRPDLCGLLLEPAADSALWNLEQFDSGPGCNQ